MILILAGMSTMGTSVFSLLPVVVKELVGQQHVTFGMGLVSVVQTIGFPVSSYLTGNYIKLVSFNQFHSARKTSACYVLV